MALRLHCDVDGCVETTSAGDTRWVVVATDVVIGGVGNGQRLEAHFCSYDCLSAWAARRVRRVAPLLPLAHHAEAEHTTFTPSTRGQWYACSCGALHDTPVCPFGSERS
jgi:hypothetical protein